MPEEQEYITLKQAAAFAKALAKGDPREGGVFIGAMRQVLGSLLPGEHR